MAAAPVGDDQYGEDPSVNQLQERTAELLGKEAALFVPSGTMANQIGQFFRAQGDAAAVDGIEDHLRKFWDPRMRRKLIEHWQRAEGEGLSPLVAEALRELAVRMGVKA